MLPPSYSPLFIEGVKVNTMHEIAIKLLELHFFYCTLKINHDIACREDKTFFISIPSIIQCMYIIGCVDRTTFMDIFKPNF